MKKIALVIIAMWVVMAAHAVTYSGTLPVMFINTEGGVEITSKENYVNATYYLDPMGVSGVEAFGSADAPLPLEIRGRGNYTWKDFDKKPYRLKLAEKTPLLGMTKSKHFALMAGADDPNGYLRNVVGLELSRLIGMKWTPADVPVEVVLNGDYIGLYFLTETIRVDVDRVNVAEQIDNDTDPANANGGWLLEIDNYDADPHVEITEGDGSRMVVNYSKSCDVASDVQKSWLLDQLNRMNDAIYSSDKSKATWGKMIDMNELAKYYIVQELTDDYESFHGSCYFYRDRGDGLKWYFGPVWDFGSSFTESKRRFISENRVWHQTWICEMVKFPEFMDVVKAEWRKFYAGDYTKIYDYLSAYAAKVAVASQHDDDRWEHKGYGTSDIAGKVSYIQSWLYDCANWLDNQWRDDAVTPDPVVNHVTFYFDSTDVSWNPVRAYIFDRRKDGSTWQALGSWSEMPELTLVDLNGRRLWKGDFKLDKKFDNAWIIFGDGQSGVGEHQTQDLAFVNNCIYNTKGIIGYAGVDDLVTDAPSAPIEYYNLQGMKVDDPISGQIYICRQGSTVTKILIK